MEKIRIIYSNVRGLRKKLNLLLVEISENPDAIWCFTETWLSPNFDDRSLQIKSHIFFRGDRLYNGVVRRGGGVLILVPVKYVVSEIGEHYCTEVFESIAISLHTSARPVCLVCVYRPPSITSERSFSDMFEKYYNDLHLYTKNLIIVGDFNYPDIDWLSHRVSKQSSAAESFLNFVLSNGLHQLVTSPTRENHMLDLIMVNEISLLENIAVMEPLGSSDHSQILLDICCDSLPPGNTLPEHYNFYKADFDTIEKILVNIPWEENFANFASLDEKVGFLNKTLWSLFEAYVPRSKQYTHQFRFSRQIIDQRKLVRSLYKKSKGDKESILYARYKTELKVYKQQIKQAFYEEERKVLEQKSVRKFWNYVRRKTCSKFNIPTLLDGDVSATDDHDKAELFNTYFCSVFTQDDGQQPRLPPPSLSMISDIEFDAVDVFDVLQRESCKLSSGPDLIPHIVYRRLAAVLAYPLFLVFKESLETGTVPILWKKADVVPIHKTGARAVVENYRPISLTCVACRILERIVFRKIIQYCIAHKIISENQHGFLRRKSTVTQMLECMDIWTKAFDNKETVKIAYLDFRKAFDTVSHAKLLSVLENKGIRGKLLNWIKDFLKCRSQSVVINGIRSQVRSVTSGVPQGSVLGPLLFILFIDDISRVPKYSSMYIFADDCKLFTTSPKAAANDDNLQSDLNDISDWADERQLRLSVPKCQILTINGVNSCSFRIRNIAIEDTSEAKDLGIIIDNRLQFSAHCANKVKKASVVLHFLFTCFSSQNISFMIKMYRTFVLPILDYGSVIYNPRAAKNIRLLESIQRSFTRRLLSGRPTMSYTERLTYFNLDSLEFRRLKFDLVTVYKIMYGYTDLDFNKFFTFASRQSGRSNGLKLTLPYFKTDVRKHFFSVRIVRLWNLLPQDVVTAHSVSAFKESLERTDVKDIIHRFCKYY